MQIGQSRLTKVNNNIELLKTNKRYASEAAYFSGEFAEKLGQQEKALKSYY